MKARNLSLKKLRKRKLAIGLGRRDKFHILDIGCGTGRDVREFCLEPDVEFDGADPCAALISEFDSTI